MRVRDKSKRQEQATRASNKSKRQEQETRARDKSKRQEHGIGQVSAYLVPLGTKNYKYLSPKR